MQQETSQSETDVNHDQDLVRRRAILATQFQALPIYGSAEFWSLVEEPQLKLALPLEVLGEQMNTGRGRFSAEFIFGQRNDACLRMICMLICVNVLYAL